MMWDWESDWRVIRTFHGHEDSVKHITFNPNDHNTFASALSDFTSKIWSLKSSTPMVTLNGHEGTVNCVDYFLDGQKTYLITCSDDTTIKVWNLDLNICISTISCQRSLSSVCPCPDLPIIVCGSDYGTISVYNVKNFRLEKRIKYGLEGINSIAYLKGSGRFVIAH